MEEKSSTSTTKTTKKKKKKTHKFHAVSVCTYKHYFVLYRVNGAVPRQLGT